MKIHQLALAAALLSATAMGHAACYTVYKADGTILLETSTSPVDLTEQIGDTIPARFGPGATMTMSEHGFHCIGRAAELNTQNSLAEAVRAEEKKALLVKGPAPALAAREEPAKVQVAAREEGVKTAVAREDGAKTVMVKEDGTKTVVQTQQGTVLKVKGKAKEKEAQ